MKSYELTYLISPDLSETEANSQSEKIGSFIQEAGGILGETKKIIKRGLGYPIKGKNTAYLIVLDFQLEPEKLIIIEKKLKAEPQTLRYLIFVKKLLKKKKAIRRIPEKKALIELKPRAAEKPAEKKVKLEEIEKKLEEILQ